MTLNNTSLRSGSTAFVPTKSSRKTVICMRNWSAHWNQMLNAPLQKLVGAVDSQRWFDSRRSFIHWCESLELSLATDFLRFSNKFDMSRDVNAVPVECKSVCQFNNWSECCGPFNRPNAALFDSPVANHRSRFLAGPHRPWAAHRHRKLAIHLFMDRPNTVLALLEPSSSLSGFLDFDYDFAGPSSSAIPDNTFVVIPELSNETSGLCENIQRLPNSLLETCHPSSSGLMNCSVQDLAALTDSAYLFPPSPTSAEICNITLNSEAEAGVCVEDCSCSGFPSFQRWS